ncbi:hypothetical protein ACSU6B_28440, partial [Neobacillus sp. C211]|uniref:hypothetical protein n=1 Tax=unclassified Neobacillus TaxID=2675272 RepID=UPI00397AB3B1
SPRKLIRSFCYVGLASTNEANSYCLFTRLCLFSFQRTKLFLLATIITTRLLVFKSDKKDTITCPCQHRQQFIFYQ